MSEIKKKLGRPRQYKEAMHPIIIKIPENRINQLIKRYGTVQEWINQLVKKEFKKGE